jgi:hypothetical protein
MGAKKCCFCDADEANEPHFFIMFFCKKLCGALVSLPTIFPHPPISKYVWK